MEISAEKPRAHGAPADFADRMLTLLPRLAENQMRSERNYLARGLLTLPQLWTLRTIGAHAACAMHALAQAQGVGASTVTGQADRLVKLGLVRRRLDPADRRAVLVTITPKGRRILAALLAEKRQALVGLFGRLTARERGQCLNLLEKLIAIQAAQPRRGAGERCR